jgi:hypothetical protein
VVSRIGDEARVIGEHEPLRVAQGRALAIDERGDPGAEQALESHGVAVRRRATEHAMVRRIGDREAVPVQGHLSGDGERAWRDGRRLRREVERLLVQRSVGAGGSEDALDEGGDRVGGELGAVDPDDGDRAAEPALDVPQLREHVDAVDSAAGPEVEQQQLAPEVTEGESACARVQPIEGIGRVGGANGGSGNAV